MKTPIADFVRQYSLSGTARFHMPGHKGRPFLGCEGLDITEIAGADALYEAEGIIAASERSASELFGSRRTLFSTEGSSQCIRAMLALALWKGLFKHPFGKLALTLLLAGAVGNLIDRAFRGYVVDMFNVLFMDFAVFNVADICVVVGGFLMVFYVLFLWDRDKEAGNDPA